MFFISGAFWYLMGLLSLLVAAGAIYWAKDLGLKMNWWKWTLAAVWYFLINFSVMAGATFAGEGEPTAGWRTTGFMLVILVIVGVGIWRLIAKDRDKTSS